MKYLYLFVVSFVFCLNTKAQIRIAEPDFEGEVLAVLNDTSAVLLEKVNAQVKITDQLMGPVKKIDVVGRKSPIRLKQGKLQLIVRSVDNNTDPMAIIRVFKFTERKTRKATIEKQNEITGKISYNQYDYVPFTGKKYGQSSYLLTINNISTGEYGITLNNPYTVDEKMLIVSCFGVD